METIFRTTLFVFCLAFCFCNATAQNFKQQYKDLAELNDTVGQKQLLNKWEKSNNNDPELYVAYFNYYAHASRKEVIALGQHPKGENVL